MKTDIENVTGGYDKYRFEINNDFVNRDAIPLGKNDKRCSTSLLIIGAGPYGLSLAAYAHHLGMDYILVGSPMAFWRQNMSPGMYLRSRCDWHLDPLDRFTIENFLRLEKGMRPQEAEPIPLPLYLNYADWFQKKSQVQALSGRVIDLKVIEHSADAIYVAQLENGGQIEASNVVIATGVNSGNSDRRNSGNSGR